MRVDLKVVCSCKSHKEVQTLLDCCNQIVIRHTMQSRMGVALMKLSDGITSSSRRLSTLSTSDLQSKTMSCSPYMSGLRVENTRIIMRVVHCNNGRTLWLIH